MRTELSRMLLHLSSVHQWTQKQIAGFAGVSQPAVNSLMQGARPSHGTLRKLCQQAPRDAGAQIMIAHLSDEIRAGGFMCSEIVAGVGVLKPVSATVSQMQLDRIASVAGRRRA